MNRSVATPIEVPNVPRTSPKFPRTRIWAELSSGLAGSTPPGRGPRARATALVRLGRTSITVNVTVEAERGDQVLQVTEAELVYVGVDAKTRQPTPLLSGK